MWLSGSMNVFSLNRGGGKKVKAFRMCKSEIVGDLETICQNAFSSVFRLLQAMENLNASTEKGIERSS